jgi:hypothetical protein
MMVKEKKSKKNPRITANLGLVPKREKELHWGREIAVKDKQTDNHGRRSIRKQRREKEEGPVKFPARLIFW